MGNIITMQDDWYSYPLPEMPKDEKEILGYDLPKKEQFWRIPPRIDLKRTSPTQKVEYVNRERDRWLNGHWFFNYGEPTYITGMHYDHMVYQTFEFGKARYFDQQRLDFYMRDLVRKDKNCYGASWFKPRRYGLTAEEITNCIYVGMEDFNNNVGVTSNEGTKAVTTLMRPIVSSVIARPKYMRPNFYKPSGKKPRKSMEFTDGQIEFDEDEMMDEFRNLNGTILPYNTTPAAMDGTKKRYILMNEVWKWVVASVMETLAINKKCVEDFGIYGKISLDSTMGDSDDYKQAIREGILIGDQSNPNIRDGNGRTISGLYRYFISAVHSKILPAEFTDQYGRVNVDQATSFIMNDRAKFDPNSKDYLFEVRRMPLTYEEATSTAEALSVFPNIRLGKRRKVLAGMLPHQKPYVIGFLKDSTNSEVNFEPNPKGDWHISVQPYVNKELGIDTRNRFKKEMGGKIKPPKNQEFCWGYDPIRYSDVFKLEAGNKIGGKSSSAACILVGQKYNYYDPNNKIILPRLAGIWLKRPDSPHDAHYEVNKACRYWSMAGMYERQVESVLDDFEEWKMLAMLMRSEKDNEYGMWTDGRRIVVKNGVEMIQSAMKIEDGEDRDPIDDIPFEEVIADRMMFDPFKTTPHNVTMADIMLNYGYKQMKFTNHTEEMVHNNKIRTVLFPKRTNG